MADPTPPAAPGPTPAGHAAHHPPALLVSRNFPPLVGGMERLVFEVYRHLAQRGPCTLLGPRGSANFVSAPHQVIESRLSPAPLFLLLSLLRGLRRVFSKPRPRIVMGGSGLVAPVVWLLGLAARSRTVVLIHGLDVVVDSRIYQALFLPFLRRCDLLIANSANTVSLAVERGCRRERIRIVHPGTSLPDQQHDRAAARGSLGIRQSLVLLSVGRLVRRKGLPEFVEHCLPEVVRQHPDTVLIIAGNEPTHALRSDGSSVTHAIHRAIERQGLHDHVKLLGHASDEQLERLYAAADALVFPLRETPGDVEGFGMVAVEAAARGTPTVAFRCGGVADAVAEGQSGFLVAPGDYPAFATRVLALRGLDLHASCRAFAARFSWAHYAKQLDACLASLDTEGAAS